MYEISDFFNRFHTFTGDCTQSQKTNGECMKYRIFTTDFTHSLVIVHSHKRPAVNVQNRLRAGCTVHV
jgi:hypothetical protein